jgi:uncharacterized protein YbjT (DUF2867 family)
MHPVLVIGATGNIGREVVAALTAAGSPVRAMSRSGDARVLGDLTRPETLEACLDGVETVFLVWTAPREFVGPALDRITAGTRRIVFLSSPYKTPHPFFQQPNPVRELHAEIERRIEDSGREWTFLRPGMLASNAVVWWSEQIRAGDVVRWPFADVPTAPIDERDIAAVAVRALLDDGHAGAEYVLTGAEALTHAEQVATIGRAIGRKLQFEEMSAEEALKELGVRFPPVIVKMLLDAWAAGTGHPAHVTSTVAAITGTPARTYVEWAADHAAAFTGATRAEA